MKTPRKVIEYAKNNYNEVVHTTLNPEGPGVVRIHLIPPRIIDNDVLSSVAIINGQDIIPVNVAWSILLSELIKEVNKYSGREVTKEETDSIVNNAVKSVKKVFPMLPKRIIKRDIFRIMNTFTQIAYGQIPDEEIDYMTMGDYAAFMRAPHRMDLLVSAMTKEGKWHCNQNCVHCYAAGQEHVSENELSTEEWKHIIDKCKDNCIPQLTFTGGEPTMREDLFDLIDYARWFVTRLNTNGIKLTKEYCERLASVSLDSCQITFYSGDEDKHNTLVGAKQYQNTLAGIKNALAAGLNISINTPLCTLNKDYVATLRFLHELGVEYVTCSGMICTGNALTAISEDMQLTGEELKAVLKEAYEFCKANAMEISFTSPGWIEKEFFDELGMSTPTCGACLSNMAITPGGNVVPCQSYLSDELLGNMLQDDWDSIWNSTACSNIRSFSAESTGLCPLKLKKEDK